MKLIKIFAIATMAISLTSCVSKKQYEALNLNYKQCIESAGERQRQIQDLQSANAGLTSENNLLRDQNGALKSSLDACLANAGKGSANIDKLIGEIENLEQSYEKDRLLGRTLNAIGVYKSSYGAEREAIELYTKAVRLAEKINDFPSYLTFKSNLAETYIIVGDFHLCKDTINSVISKSRELGDKNNESYGLLILGNCLIQTEKYLDAMTVLELSIQLMKNTNSLLMLPYAFALIGEASLKTNLIEKAKNNLILAKSFEPKTDYIVEKIEEVSNLIYT